MKDASLQGFHEAAKPMPTARIFAWGARAVYVGPALNLSAHRNAVAVLALGLNGPFDVAVPWVDGSTAYRRTTSVLIAPNTLHHFRFASAPAGFVYVDALSSDFERLRCSARIQESHAYFSLADETAYIAIMNGLALEKAEWQAARPALEAKLSGQERLGLDRRVKAILSILHNDVGRRASLATLADYTSLSESRLRHLFKEATGVPLRRYRIWIAMRLALQRMASGKSLTSAAMDAGFSSSAHFSTAFRDMFGMEPSRLAKGQLGLTAEPGQPL